MANSFQVNYILLSDYAAQMEGGKNIIAGLYGNDIWFSSPPPALPALFCFVTLRPLKATGAPIIRLIGPNGEVLFYLHTRFEMADEPQPLETINLHIQLPSIPFPGEGLYRIGIFDNNQMIFDTSIKISMGEPTPRQVNVFTTKIGLGPDS